jgi:hypothetical protein
MLTISTESECGRNLFVRPVGQLIGLMCLSGIAYLTAVLCLRRPFAADRHWWVWMIGVGITMRLLSLPSTPMMEDDYCRYLWDGALITHGYSPYAGTPYEIVAGAVAPELVELAGSATVLDRVNHPWLNSTYPRFAQLTIAAAFGLWGVGRDNPNAEFGARQAKGRAGFLAGQLLVEGGLPVGDEDRFAIRVERAGKAVPFHPLPEQPRRGLCGLLLGHPAHRMPGGIIHHVH